MVFLKKRVTSPSDSDFDALWQLYLDSFPESEQRTKSKAIKLLKNSDLHLYSYCINGELLAGVWFWEFENYLFLEFISVSNNFRNGGYGSLILDDIIENTHNKPIILEIDQMIDDISTRRYGFYNRHGFVMNDFEHTTPAYNDSNNMIKLHVLTYKEKITNELYEEFYENLVNNIIL